MPLDLGSLLVEANAPDPEGEYYRRATAALNRPIGAPACPHTRADGTPTCTAPMRSVGDAVYECANDHRGRKVKPRDSRAFPDLPKPAPYGGA